MYEPSSSSSIDLDSTEQSDVVMKVLKLAGISLDTGVYQAAASEEIKNIQQEKQ